MKIRRFKHKDAGAGHVGWAGTAYMEFHDDLIYRVSDDGAIHESDDKVHPVWSLLEAEELVENGYWVELGTPLLVARLGDWPEDFAHENGNYWCGCLRCSAEFTGHKRRQICKVCDRVQPANIPTMDSAELFQHFRNFRYAKMTTSGLGNAYPHAVAFIDEQVRIRVTEILKGMK